MRTKFHIVDIPLGYHKTTDAIQPSCRVTGTVIPSAGMKTWGFIRPDVNLTSFRRGETCSNADLFYNVNDKEFETVLKLTGGDRVSCTVKLNVDNGMLCATSITLLNPKETPVVDLTFSLDPEDALWKESHTCSTMMTQKEAFRLIDKMLAVHSLSELHELQAELHMFKTAIQYNQATFRDYLG